MISIVHSFLTLFTNVILSNPFKDLLLLSIGVSLLYFIANIIFSFFRGNINEKDN